MAQHGFIEQNLNNDLEEVVFKKIKKYHTINIGTESMIISGTSYILI